MGQVSVWFDDEGDFLEVTVDEEEGHFNDLGDGVFERVDEEGTTIGFAVLNVTSRKERDLPFDAEFTKLSSYTDNQKSSPISSGHPSGQR